MSWKPASKNLHVFDKASGACHTFEHCTALQLTVYLSGRVERRRARRRATLAQAASPVSSVGRTATATQCARAPTPCCACPRACLTTRFAACPGTRQEPAVASSTHPSRNTRCSAGAHATRSSTAHAAVGVRWLPAEACAARVGGRAPHACCTLACGLNRTQIKHVHSCAVWLCHPSVAVCPL